MEPATDIQSPTVPHKSSSREPDTSDVPDSKTPPLESSVDISANIKDTRKRENGSIKLSPLTSTQHTSDPKSSNLGSTDVVSSSGPSMDAPVSPEPSNEHNYTSELYISPPPSISLCSRPPLLSEDTASSLGVGDKDRGAASSPFADTKAVLADRRSNFFSEITRAPVLLPSSVSHSSVLSFQPTANVVADLRHSKCVTANGHSELAINLVQPGSLECSAAPRDSPSKTVELANNSDEVDRAVAPRDPVVIVYQAAPPPDSAELVSLVGQSYCPVVLEVEEEALAPRFCARMEPSPERFWGPSVTPVRAGSNSLLRGSERAGHVAELRLVGSTGQLETVGGSVGSSRGTAGGGGIICCSVEIASRI